MTEIEAAWAAGLFEGEGTIVWHKTNEAPFLSLAMSDEDVVRRFQRAVGGGTVTGPYRQTKYPNGKPMFMWRLSNYQDASELMALFIEHFGVRRQARWAEVQEKYRASTKKRRPQAKRTRESRRVMA